MATGPGFYDNLCPQSWQDGSAATFTLNDPHQQREHLGRPPVQISNQACLLQPISDTCCCFLAAFDCPGN